MTYVLTENKTISYPNMAVALGLNEPVANLLSVPERRGARGVRCSPRW
jgi:hypothetical protein